MKENQKSVDIPQNLLVFALVVSHGSKSLEKTELR
jgi:hypothetical protein